MLLKAAMLLIGFIGGGTVTGLMIGAMFTGTLPSVAKWRSAR